MSNQHTGTAPGGPVSVTKAVERKGEGFIIEYEFASTGQTSTTVRLSDRIPTENVGEFGFHEEYRPSEWTVDDDELQFRVRLDAEASRSFVLGVVSENGETISYDSTDPTLEIVDCSEPSDPEEAAFFEQARQSILDEDSAGEATSGNRENATAKPRQESALDAAVRRVDADGGEPQTDSDAADAADAADASVDGDVVAALVAQLEAGRVSDSQRAALEEHFGGGRSESETVRLEYVQKRLADFDAYVDALDELLSVHGTGEDAITRLETRLEALDEAVASIRRRQAEFDDRLEALSETLAAHEETLESVRTDHETELEELRRETTRHRETVSEELDALQQSLEADVASLEAELVAFDDIRRTMAETLQRPADAAASEDADATALEGTESISIVDPGDTNVSGDTVNGDTTDERSADIETSLDERLENAEASNFSGPTAATEAYADDTGGDADPAASEDADVATDDSTATEETVSPEASGSPEEPPEDETETAATDHGMEDVCDFGVAADEASGTDAEDGVADEAPDAEDADRAGSIFDIGDADTTSESDGEEVPTIDFEDT